MTSGQRWTLILVGAALLAFGIGAGWQYARVAEVEARLAQVERDLQVQRLQNMLATAALEAQRGRHEVARQIASSFFTTLQADVETAAEDARTPLRDILARRDAIITALSRAEPDAAGELAQLLVRLRLAFGEQVAPPAGPPTPPTPQATTDTADTIR